MPNLISRLTAAIRSLIGSEAGAQPLSYGQWTRLASSATSGLITDATLDVSRSAIDEILSVTRAAAIRSPIISRGVRLTAEYTWAQGYTIDCADDEIRAAAQAILNDRYNRAVLFGLDAIIAADRTLQVEGNLFLCVYPPRVATRNQNGHISDIRILPVDEIRDIIVRDDDPTEPRWYQRVVTKVAGSYSRQTYYYPDWRLWMESPILPQEAPRSDGEVIWAPVIHAIDDRVIVSRAWFGVPAIYAAVPWAVAYKSWLEDGATVARAQSRIAAVVSGMRSRREVEAATQRIEQMVAQQPGARDEFGTRSRESLVGAVAMLPDGKRYDVMRLSGALLPLEDARRLLLMCCAALGWPETFFGDVSVGTLATAKSLDRPSELRITARRAMWASLLSSVIAAALVSQQPDGRSRRRMIERLSTTPVAVKFPSLLEHDIEQSVRAVISAATLDGKPLAGTMTRETLVRKLFEALSDDRAEDELRRLSEEEDYAGAQSDAELFESMHQAPRLLEESAAEWIDENREAIEKARMRRQLFDRLGIIEHWRVMRAEIELYFKSELREFLPRFKAAAGAGHYLAEARREPPSGDWWEPALDAAAELARGRAEAAMASARRALVRGALSALDEIQVSLDFDIRDERVIQWARERAAEMVRNVTDTTRGELRRIITRAIREGWSVDQTADRIAAKYVTWWRPLEDGVQSRADLIAFTEIGNAYEQGSMMAMLDVNTVFGVEKFWQTFQDDRVDEECAFNEAQGWIPVEDTFQSGDVRPLAHPNCRCYLRYRRAEANAEEAVRLSAEHLPGQHDQRTHGRKKGFGEHFTLEETSERAFTGSQRQLKTKLSKQDTGLLGEELAASYMRKKYGVTVAKTVSAGPQGGADAVDLLHDHQLIEVKTGLVSNSSAAQQWRITFSVSAKEREILAKMTPAERAQWRAAKQKAAMDRKRAKLEKFNREHGVKTQAKTITLIVDPDRKLVDIFEFSGFHQRIGWKSQEAKNAYVGSYRYR